MSKTLRVLPAGERPVPLPTLKTLCALVALASVVGCAPASSPDDVGFRAAASLTAVADTFVRSGKPNQPQGAGDFMRVRKSGKNRALIRFDQAELVAAIAGGTVDAAAVELSIQDIGNNWGDGRTVDLHRVTADWTEGGATWNCAVDSDPSNQAADCSGATEWEMGNAGPHPWDATPSDTVTLNSGQTGGITFDVTADVAAFVAGTAPNYGWVLKKTEEGQNGWVTFDTQELGTPASLALDYTSADPCDGVVAIPDAALEALVRTELAIPLGDITGADMELLTSLNEFFSGVTDLTGLQCADNLDELVLPFTPITDLAPLSGLDLLTRVWLQGNGGISDISPLSGATGMDDLRLGVSGTESAFITDISALSGMTQLRILDISQHDVADLSALSGKALLRELIAFGNPITDLAPLAGDNDLTRLWVQANAGITDLSPLVGAVDMDDLRVGVAGTEPAFITDISALAGMTQLRFLDISQHEVGDLTALSGKANLRELLAFGNPFTDLSPLSTSPLLFRAWFQDNGGITDLSPLSGATAMRDLRVGVTGTQAAFITDISVLAAMPALETFHAENHEIVDLTPLLGLTALEQLVFFNNEIVDTTPLAGMCQLTQLWMHGNDYSCPDPTLAALQTCGVPAITDCP